MYQYLNSQCPIKTYSFSSLFQMKKTSPMYNTINLIQSSLCQCEWHRSVCKLLHHASMEKILFLLCQKRQWLGLGDRAELIKLFGQIHLQFWACIRNLADPSAKHRHHCVCTNQIWGDGLRDLMNFSLGSIWLNHLERQRQTWKLEIKRPK